MADKVKFAVKIEKNIPIPPRCGPSGQRIDFGLPLEDMKVGDAIELPENYPFRWKNARDAIMKRMQNQGLKAKFARRGNRVWRIK